jgi:uncharacterized membrane protein YczE
LFDQKILIRYFLLVVGLFFMGLGISLTTKSALGTTPISSLPYVLSQIFPLSFGEFTFLLCVACLLVEVALLGRDFPAWQWLQLLVAALFGSFVDLGMFLFAQVNPQGYPGRIVVLVAGSTLLALGVYLEVIANALINPGEGVVRAIARKAGLRFGYIKIAFDLTLVAGATALSVAAMGAVKGVREGTLISALLVGSTTNLIGLTVRRSRRGKKWLAYLMAGTGATR